MHFVSVLMMSMSMAAHAQPLRQEPTRFDETPLTFVENYLAQLATFEAIRRNALVELKTESGPGMACVHNNTRYDLEYSAAIYGLTRAHLIGVGAELQTIPKRFAELYRQKREALAQMTEICATFAAGFKEGLDYGKLSAQMPKIRARLDYLSNTALEASPLIFATLISDVPDSKGHASHLIISCDERRQLVAQIDRDFGDPSTDGASVDVRIARMIRSKVLEFKCAEEPR